MHIFMYMSMTNIWVYVLAKAEKNLNLVDDLDG